MPTVKITELSRLTAVEAARKIADRQITCEQLVRACLERIAERESVVKAWAFLDPDLALKQAIACDRSNTGGALRGIPIGVKDVFDTADMPTQHNSAIYHGHQPSRDAKCVSLARKAGAIILGKTVTSEFAYRSPGPTAHPLNPAHTPGGSSSGSAAAVADFMVPLAIGTQTGASTIRPASFCGIFGFKPTYGRVSFDGGKVLSASQDTMGLFARCIEDLALFDSVLNGKPFPAQNEAVRKPFRIGYCQTPFWSLMDASGRFAVNHAVNALRSSGVSVENVDLPESFKELADINSRLVAAEAPCALGREYREHREKLSAVIRKLIEEGLRASTEDIQRARALQIDWGIKIDLLFAQYDALLAPAAVGEAPEGLQSTGDPVFSRLWMPLHLPCIAIPVTRGSKGLPVGIQLIGRLNNDQHLLAVAQYVADCIQTVRAKAE